jgi:DNA-directed RNA polymerase subunit L
MRKIVDSMDIKVLDEDKERIKIEFLDETETLTQVLATNVWNEGGQASSVKEHPFLENPKIVVMGKNPKRLLKKAATVLETNCEEFKEEFQRALQK